MMNRTVEKSTSLSSARVVLGDRPAAPQHSAPGTPLAIAPAAPCAQTRNAELERELERRDQRIAALEQELAATRQRESEQGAALAALEADFAAARADAERLGHAEGVAAAQEAADAQWRQQAALWDQALIELRERHEAALAQLGAACGELALAATAKIIGDTLSGAAPIRAAIEHLIQESGLSGPLKVGVAPEHYAQLIRAGSLASAPGETIELRPDARVRYGGCLLETEAVSVDGRYEAQLQKLAALIRAPREDAAP